MTDSELYKMIQTSDYIHTVGDVDYQVIHKDGCCILMFQETRTKSDWKVNFDFPRRMYRNGKMWIHRGYANVYKNAKDEIMNKYLSEIQSDEVPLICGWSYGASLGVLASEDYFFRTGKKAECVTFGGAKIVYSLYTKHYLKNCMNLVEYVQHNDFVTWVNPFCHRINKKIVGEKFGFKKILNTPYYHCNYDRYIE